MKVDSYNNRESETNNDRDKQTLLLEIQKEQSGYEEKEEKNIIKGGNPNPFFVHLFRGIIICFVVLVLLIIYIILGLICGFGFQKC